MARPFAEAPLVGSVFGYLTVAGERYIIRKNNTNYSYIPVKCKCGKELTVLMTAMVTGKKRSCGCLAIELIIKRNTKTGLSRTKEYRVWKGMLDRCYDSSYELFHRYGGRGIIVCDEWRDDFMAFYNYIGRCPKDKTSIDRFPDNNGHYEPGNVRWANGIEQANNRESCIYIKINSITKTLKQWCDYYGTDYCLAHSRIRYLGWEVLKALTTPKKNIL